VVRTGATTSYSFEIPDQQGTNELYLDNTAQIPTWRQFTPYGAPRGTAVTWIDNRGFLNQPTDPDTGLTYDGARAYNPATAQFISPDPVLATSDPQDLDPYDYAQDNPETNQDPSGDMMCETGGPCGSVQYLEHYNDEQSSQDTSSGGGGFDPISVLNPGCAGPGCTDMSIGDLIAPVAASTIPITKSRAILSQLSTVKSNADVFNDASYSSWLLKKRVGELNNVINERSEEIVSGGRVLRWGGVGLTVAGGAIAAYGEYNQSNGNVAKTVTVGAGDTAIGFLAGAAGSMAAGALMGTEWGAAIGTFVPVGGTAVGAVAGAVIGGVIGLASSNVFNDAVNSRIWNGITSLL
jgi:RHS repeat-associated protein